MSKKLSLAPSVVSSEDDEPEVQEITPLSDPVASAAVSTQCGDPQENGAQPLSTPKGDSQNGSIMVIEKLQVTEAGEKRSRNCKELRSDVSEDGCFFGGGIEVDSKRSWLVAVICAWVMFWTLLVNRTSSVIFVSLNEELGMPREEAATPFSMLGAVSNIFAVVSGLLIRLLPLPRVSALGTFLTSLGIVLAASIFNRLAIKYCIGVITAIGQSLIFPTNMVAVNTYFEQHRTTASGVSYVGGTLVSFVMPDVYEALVKRFGLRVTLAIIGGLTLNALIGAFILQVPARPKRVDVNLCNNNNTSVLADGKSKPARPTLQLAEIWKNPHKQLAFMKRPIFYLIMVSGIVFAYVLVLFNVTVVAFAKEKSFVKPKLTLWFYAAGDLVGRLFSGQLSDRGWLHRRTVIALGFLLGSVATFGMTISSYREACFVFCLLFGLSAGSVMILFSVLLTEYLGLANLPLALGVHCLVNGLAALPRHALIRFLSQDGSYWPLYLFMSVISVVTAVVWALHCLYIDFRSHFGVKRNPFAEEYYSPKEIQLEKNIYGDREDGAPNTLQTGSDANEERSFTTAKS
ncbi:monocarboxylate transporter 3-like [Varroa jacobsoni]|uniref:monocarboxylate transporter 3-like n=1 Tax=Varroa jacobsoni TaxID=62625 RepID=UPI000BF8C8A5|nr:monocarboxylate transporter 3-like [Varroa jacobsoni]XP_022696291.1 monocarboxylate transporter 3-like [Varroa jacobsoni]XP_022696292.1 monocarboxylate transporter 3-like [Varroa jacobsoni]